MSKIQEKISNTKYKFSQNFFKAFIFPAFAIILAVVFAFVLGFNKNLDYTGGVVVSVVAGVDVNLEDKTTFNLYKENVDKVLHYNDVKGDVYSVEINDKQEYTIVVKFAYNGSQEQKQNLITNLKADLKTEFYEDMSDYDLQNNNYILVAEFGSSVDGNVIIYTALATLVATLLMCAYIAFRNGLNSGVLAFLMTIINNAFALSLIMITRIQLAYATVAVIPFVTILSILTAFVYLRKAKTLLASSQVYEKQNNNVLANDTAKSVAYNQLLLGCISSLALLVIGLFNVCNSVLHLSLAMIAGIVAVLYTSIMILPGLFAKTYIRKVKKAKVAKEQNQDSKKLTEEEVMKETDLDNLVSN